MRDSQYVARIVVARPQLQPAQHIVIMFFESFMDAVRKLAVRQIVMEPGQYVRQRARSFDAPDVRIARAFEDVDGRRLKIP